MAVADREKALETALAQIDKQYGKGSVMRLGEEVRAPIEVIPTGSIASISRSDRRPAARSGGRDLRPGVQRQDHGGPARHRERPGRGRDLRLHRRRARLDPDYAEKLGVDTDALLVGQPDNGEQALEIADMLVRSGALALVVIDSVAAFTPRAEIEGEMGDSHVGLQARLMSQALRKMTGALSGADTTAIFINQFREKIGVMFGSPETTTGGRALKFYSSIRLDIRRIETLKDGQEMVGNRTRVKVVKNKVAPPFKQAEFDILYGQGISREGSMIDLGVEAGIVRKAGAWFTYDADQLGQGRENARTICGPIPTWPTSWRKRSRSEWTSVHRWTPRPVSTRLPVRWSSDDDDDGGSRRPGAGLVEGEDRAAGSEGARRR